MSPTTRNLDCFCGKRAVTRTTWTKENPGRRFNACLHFGRGGCRLFEWEDPPMCHRAKAIIPGLLRKINKLEGETKKLESEVQKLEDKVSQLQP
ncbi:hypothetical protein DH2020_028494 [Rehmannia glutinosa]|uniref:GRF-type domain-containing protein n=1 Tax=Rehmannia glutinosa TaxID=99300 RepID=A0ABR0VUU1_REHGL